MFDGLPCNRDALTRTVSLLTTARLRESVLLGLVDEDDLTALAEIEGATSNRLVAQSRGSGEVQSYELVYGVPHAHFINAAFAYAKPREPSRSEEHTSELQSLMRISYAVFCLKKKKKQNKENISTTQR